MRTARTTWPIIVGGCHRSGTSLVRRVLNAHTAIHCGPEVKFFRDFYNRYENDPFSHLRFSQSARNLLEEDELFKILGRAFLVIHEVAAKKVGKHRWADKNPENVFFLDRWNELLGNQWLFVHVVRDPLDTIASMKEAGFPLSLPQDMDGLIRLYADARAAGEAFAAQNPDRTLQVSYEAFVREPEAQIRALTEWMGESFEPEQIAFNEQTHDEGLEDPKIRDTRGIHTSSIGRWKTVLTAEEAEQVRERCFPIIGKTSP